MDTESTGVFAHARFHHVLPTVAPDIAAFIREHLLSVDEIEVLAAMSNAPKRWGDANRLAGLNLLDIRLTDDVRYRLHPGTPQLRRMVRCLVSAYGTNRAAVVRAIARAARRGGLDFGSH